MIAIELRDKLNAMIDRGTITETTVVKVVYEEIVFDEVEIAEYFSDNSGVYLQVL